MNSLKIVIPIFVAITIVVIIFNLTQNEIIEERVPKIENPSEIENILDKIRIDKLDNDSSDKPYIPNERKWIQSGPFKIDRDEYVLGEKIFINIEELDKTTKGQMVFYKQINNTHSFTYEEIPFDGSKPQQNYYLGINLDKFRNICTVDKLIGDWQVIFSGTNYENLEFKIIKQIIPGMEEKFEPVC
jgi:hypothetical protein